MTANSFVKNSPWNYYNSSVCKLLFCDLLPFKLRQIEVCSLNVERLHITQTCFNTEKRNWSVYCFKLKSSVTTFFFFLSFYNFVTCFIGEIVFLFSCCSFSFSLPFSFISLCVDEVQSLSHINGSLLTSGALSSLPASPTPPMDSPVPSVCSLLPAPTPPLNPPSSSSPNCGSSSSSSDQPGSGPVVAAAAGTPTSSSPSNPETEDDKAKKLLYCSLCKVAVNSLSQLEAHNKGRWAQSFWKPAI